MRYATTGDRGQDSPVSTYQFVLVLDGAVELEDADHDALHEAGCDDALLGRVDDTYYLDFDREASSKVEAVLSAIEDVESVLGAGACHLQPGVGDRCAEAVNASLELRRAASRLGHDDLERVMRYVGATTTASL